MIDFAEGRILYTLGSEVHSFKVANASDTLLLKGAPGTADLRNRRTRTGSAGHRARR